MKIEVGKTYMDYVGDMIKIVHQEDETYFLGVYSRPEGMEPASIWYYGCGTPVFGSGKLVKAVSSEPNKAYALVTNADQFFKFSTDRSELEPYTEHNPEIYRIVELVEKHSAEKNSTEDVYDRPKGVWIDVDENTKHTVSPDVRVIVRLYDGTESGIPLPMTYYFWGFSSDCPHPYYIRSYKIV